MGGAGNLESIRRAVAEVLEQEPLAAAAYVYGSIARGAFTPLSDVDVAVLTSPEVPSAERGELVRRLVTALERRVEAEVRARMDYHDFLPFELAGTREGLRALRERPARG